MSENTTSQLPVDRPTDPEAPEGTGSQQERLIKAQRLLQAWSDHFPGEWPNAGISETLKDTRTLLAAIQSPALPSQQNASAQGEEKEGNK